MRLNKLIERLKTTDKNLILMVGVPLSGKSTLIEKIEEYVDTIVSRDDILIEMGNEKLEGMSYNDAFKKVNQKNVSKELRKRLALATLSEGNVVIDMMNHKSKARRSHLKLFEGFTKYALIVKCPSVEVLLERNENRFKEEGKFIPVNVIDDLVRVYSSPRLDEGFDYIVYE
tara:strand:+ start:26567 stop:27082 length:516 start_codon:yes stop_codon:yes gene_type:complete